MLFLLSKGERHDEQLQVLTDPGHILQVPGGFNRLILGARRRVLAILAWNLAMRRR
ncbi:MAG: hypothetical protein M5U01_26480 [Ardenticatenaceae bacterium]|nr:hypothetical protein [Ardenticatenaceae bacterium]